MSGSDNYIQIGAYVYPGWHACAERDSKFPPEWSEWELVLNAPARFPDHNQPRLPADGIYDDSDPLTAQKQVGLACKYGVDFFVYGFFWSRGKRVFEAALDNGFLGMDGGGNFPFSLMWANRMPRGVLPVKHKSRHNIDPGRLVYTDPDDFLELIKFLEERYFSRPNYFRVNDMPMLSIFDSTFFLRQMGEGLTSLAIYKAKDYLIRKGYHGLYLIAINPAPAKIVEFKKTGFNSISHYVWLPDWKGKYQQDYDELLKKRSNEWKGFADKSGFTYFPSVSPGWDATPRAAVKGYHKPERYPWWPVVVNEDPALFSDFLCRAINYTKEFNKPQLSFIASWNEWSEGHYLEPDKRFGTAWLEAVRKAKQNAI